jgi:predicted phosphodiesterase
VRIFLASDLHTEFHRDAGQSFVEGLDSTGADALVVAGDVSDFHGVHDTLALLARRFARVPVIYVAGNHEHYGSDLAGTRARILSAVDVLPNLRYLERGVYEHHLGGRVVRFLGATLWFRQEALAGPVQLMNDFRQIQGFARWVGKENRTAVEFLRRELREGDVVVTHYLPARACIVPRFRGSATNPFFVCDVEALIRARKPALWIHGHTHDSVDVTVGATRIVCNPLGYVGHALNPRFDAGFTVEV